MAVKPEYIFGVIFILSIVSLLRYHYHLSMDPASLSRGKIVSNDQQSDLVVEKDSKLKSINEVQSNSNEIQRLVVELKSKDETIQKLQQQLKEVQAMAGHITNNVIKSNSVDTTDSNSSSAQSHTNFILNVSDTKLTQFCEERFGIQLIDSWRNTEEVWCSSDASSSSTSASSRSHNNIKNNNHPSELKCYPYHQAHKKLDGRAKDMFCIATNFIMDFSKIHGSGDHSDGGNTLNGVKPPLGDQYHEFDTGSLKANCRKTEKYKESLFMPHHKQQMHRFQSDSPLHTEGSSTYQIEERPTYLLARDEDCENTFHTTADMMNMFLVLNVLNLSPLESQLQVMLFDKHPDGPYKDFIGQVYAPYKNSDESSALSHSVLRASHYKNKLVLFRQLIFHLESPAGLIFPKVTRPDPVRCFSTSFFQAYRRFVLHSLSLWDTAVVVTNTAGKGTTTTATTPLILIPTVTLTLRHRTSSKNVGRVMANEAEVISLLRQTGGSTMIDLHVADFSTMPFLEQLKLIRKTNVLIGVHGAGLMLIMFAAEEAVLLEIHPSYRQDRHFRHAARMTGKYYMSIRARQRETCHGSSDNVVVPMEEFRYAIDGAIRLARTFDGGLVECGLTCPSEILAMDPRLDGYYKFHQMVKGKSIDTSFPC